MIDETVFQKTIYDDILDDAVFYDDKIFILLTTGNANGTIEYRVYNKDTLKNLTYGVIEFDRGTGTIGTLFEILQKELDNLYRNPGIDYNDFKMGMKRHTHEEAFVKMVNKIEELKEYFMSQFF